MLLLTHKLYSGQGNNYTTLYAYGMLEVRHTRLVVVASQANRKMLESAGKHIRSSLVECTRSCRCCMLGNTT